MPPQTRLPSPVWPCRGWSSLPVITQLVCVFGLKSSTRSNALPENPPATNRPFPEIVNHYEVGPEQNFMIIMIIQHIWGYFYPTPFTTKKKFFFTLKPKITFSHAFDHNCILKGLHVDFQNTFKMLIFNNMQYVPAIQPPSTRRVCNFGAWWN